MADRYNDWSSPEIEKLLMLDRNQRFVDEELTEEFDRRCTEALDEVFEELCVRYPNVVDPQGRSRGSRHGGFRGDF